MIELVVIAIVKISQSKTSGNGHGEISGNDHGKIGRFHAKNIHHSLTEHLLVIIS